MVQHNGPDRAAVPRDTLNPTDIPATQPSPPTHFRPFRRQQECSVVAQAMKYLENSGFYYGPLEVDEAHARLAHLPLGTFLIRDSTQTDVFFTLSYQAPEGPTSVRVLLGDEGFALDGSKHAFPCLFALLEFYIASPKRSLRNPYRGTSSQTLQEIARRAVVRVYGRDGLEALPVSATVRSYLQLYPFGI
ncbi:suppressor of cytokine signaling 1b [Electrophorus electricus]|nr:suppressor of cytokine signaling 1b [Electrophorus electricus]XP_026871576.2 suppressor of cytokine signaling 1b [Electrophorus electricus]